MSCNICFPEVRTVRNIVHLATRCAIAILFAITLPSNVNAVIAEDDEDIGFPGLCSPNRTR
jgi:hypothetical protein